MTHNVSFQASLHFSYKDPISETKCREESMGNGILEGSCIPSLTSVGHLSPAVVRT